MEQTIDFNGGLTPFGQQIIGFMESQISAAEATGVEQINRMAGMYKFYYTNVYKLGALTPGQWLRDFPGMVESVVADMRYMESQQQQAEKVEEAVSANAELSEKLEALSAQLTEALSKIAALEGKTSTKRKPKAAEEPETETPEAEQEA